MNQIVGAWFKHDDELYYVIKMTNTHRGRQYDAWNFFMFDEISGDLQYLGNLSEGLFFLEDVIKHFIKHDGQPPEWDK